MPERKNFNSCNNVPVAHWCTLTHVSLKYRSLHCDAGVVQEGQGSFLVVLHFMICSAYAGQC